MEISLCVLTLPAEDVAVEEAGELKEVFQIPIRFCHFDHKKHL